MSISNGFPGSVKLATKSIELLAEADYVYFADGWMHYRGCIIEHECAVRYEKTIL